jgi:hypothetical protein
MDELTQRPILQLEIVILRHDGGGYGTATDANTNSAYQSASQTSWHPRALGVNLGF